MRKAVEFTAEEVIRLLFDEYVRKAPGPLAFSARNSQMTLDGNARIVRLSWEEGPYDPALDLTHTEK